VNFCFFIYFTDKIEREDIEIKREESEIGRKGKIESWVCEMAKLTNSIQKKS
jgi:hypothetical protein